MALELKELGYTPGNLTTVIEHFNLKRQDVADITGTKNRKTVYNWECPIDDKSHADMPHRKWLMLLEKLELNT
ncbi:MAG: hypothetical protein ACK5LJ_16355 [Paracoccus sp. (in: a-proteobacteria)]